MLRNGLPCAASFSARTITHLVIFRQSLSFVAVFHCIHFNCHAFSFTVNPTFSVSQFTTWHQTFEEDLALYAKLGITGIEICERKLSTDREKAHEQLKQVKEHGLTVTSVQPRCHALFPDSMSPHPEPPEERFKRYCQSIDLFATAFPEQNIPFVAISGNAPNFDFRLAHATARRLYPQLADYAADHGVRIMYEPLNPILMNADTFICSLDGALDLIKEVSRLNFGLMLDVWHVWHEPRIAEKIETLKELIFGVHICDWPQRGPRHVGDRVLPGDGVIDLPRLYGAIDASGYKGAYCLEIFSIDELPDSLWQQDPSDVLQRGRDGFIRGWETYLACS